MLNAIAEVLEIARRAGIRVHISHIKVSGRSAWGKAAAVMPDDIAAAPYPDSAEKVRRMLERLDVEGFTDFYG